MVMETVQKPARKSKSLDGGLSRRMPEPVPLEPWKAPPDVLQLIADYERFIRKVARQWQERICSSLYDDHDIAQEIVIGIMQEAKRYPRESYKPSKIISFVARLICSRIIKRLYVAKKRAKLRQIYSNHSNPNIIAGIAVAKTPDPAEVVAERDELRAAREKIEAGFAKCPGRNAAERARKRQIMNMLYGLSDGVPRSMDDVSEFFGLSHWTIGKHHSNALHSLRLALGVDIHSVNNFASRAIRQGTVPGGRDMSSRYAASRTDVLNKGAQGPRQKPVPRHDGEE